MDNKNLLLLVGAAGIFWYVRNQQADKKTTTAATGGTATAPNTGAATYVPSSAPVASTNPSLTTNLFANLNNIIKDGTALYQQGHSVFDTIKDALHIPPATPPATPSDVWAGPRYEDYATA